MAVETGGPPVFGTAGAGTAGAVPHPEGPEQRDGPRPVYGGMLLENDPLWGKYLETVILRLRRAASGLERAKDPALAARQKRFLKVIEELEKRKGAWSRANGR